MSNADVDFVFNYTDVGSGFNNPVDGPARRAALELAASIFGSSALANYNATIQIDATGTAPPLAAAGSNDFGNPAGGGFGRTGVIRNKILTGTDLNGAASDGVVDWNFDLTVWELDINATVDIGEFDFYSTVYHELTHTLGWLDTIDLSDGADGFGDGLPGGDPGEWSKYDQFISDNSGASLINGTTFINDQAANYENLATGGTSPGNGLFFNGPNATAANGGNPVGLYTPTTFESGSSVGHLDDDNPALAGLMMLSAADTGPSARTFSSLELGVLQDLGYTLIGQINPGISQPSIIPEPSTSVLLVCGLAGLVPLRRRKYR